MTTRRKIAAFAAAALLAVVAASTLAGADGFEVGPDGKTYGRLTDEMIGDDGSIISDLAPDYVPAIDWDDIVGYVELAHLGAVDGDDSRAIYDGPVPVYSLDMTGEQIGNHWPDFGYLPLGVTPDDAAVEPFEGTETEESSNGRG